jgi:hypothetical protein
MNDKLNFAVSLLSIPLTIAGFIFLDITFNLPTHCDVTVSFILLAEGIWAVSSFIKIKNQIY